MTDDLKETKMIFEDKVSWSGNVWVDSFAFIFYKFIEVIVNLLVSKIPYIFLIGCCTGWMFT